MRIALYEPSSSLLANGSVRVQLELARGFLACGHEVDYLCRRFSGELEHLIPNELRGFELTRWNKFLRPTSVATYLRDQNPDVLLSADETFGMCLAARTLARTKTKIIAAVHDPLSIYFKDRGSVYGRAGSYATQMILPLTDKVVAVSYAVARDLATFHVKPSHIEVIYNPTDIEALKVQASQPVDHPWLTVKTKPVVISVGRFSEQKNYAALLHVFKRLRDFFDARLILIGDGVQRPLLEALRSELGLQDCVDLPGVTTNPLPLVKNADIFALTSRYEAFGLVLTEALCVGTPVVTFDCPGGVREILADGRYGTLVPAEDYEGFARALLETLKNPPPSEPLKKRAQDFSAEASVAKYLRMFSKLL